MKTAQCPSCGALSYPVICPSVIVAITDGDRLLLTIEPRWLQDKPLLRADLEGEPEDMQDLGIRLKLARE